MATVDLGAIRFNWKGAYAGGTAYVVDDVVSSGGASYICILASTGNATSNATYWSVMSSAGTNGTDIGTTITTQGDLLYRDGSGLQRLAKGTAGQALKINSGATAPEWGGVTAGLSTIWIPAIAMVSPTTNGAELNAIETTAVKPEIKVLDFDPSTIEYAQFSIAMPKSWDESTVTAKFYWTHATAVATDVMWAIQGVCVSDNDTIDATFGTAVVVTDTFHNAAEDLAISPVTTAITLGGTPAEDDLAYFQVYRAATTAGDTTNSTDAQLIGVKILFTTNAENDA
jgi:hypothetical protein